MVITSLTNAKIVDVTKLADKKYRKSRNQFVIEGDRLISDAIKRGANVVSVFVAESVSYKYNYDKKVVVRNNVFAKMCDTVNSQGILAIVEIPSNELQKPRGNCLVLDKLQDPGNVGTLIRSAVACGFTDIYAVNSVDLYSPKVLRSAMSAHFCAKLYQCNSIEDIFGLLEDCQVVVADMGGENVFQTQFADRVALIVGNEGNGISDFSKQHANKIIAIPMENNFESLNAAVAGSVIMYQIYANK